MNKLGIFMNFWEKGWAADHKKYIKKAAEIGFDILEFQAQPLLEMTDDHIRDLRKTADEYGIELTYSLGLDPRYDVSSLDESIRKGGVTYLSTPSIISLPDTGTPDHSEEFSVHRSLFGWRIP